MKPRGRAQRKRSVSSRLGAECLDSLSGVLLGLDISVELSRCVSTDQPTRARSSTGRMTYDFWRGDFFRSRHDGAALYGKRRRGLGTQPSAIRPHHPASPAGNPLHGMLKRSCAEANSKNHRRPCVARARGHAAVISGRRPGVLHHARAASASRVRDPVSARPPPTRTQPCRSSRQSSIKPSERTCGKIGRKRS